MKSAVSANELYHFTKQLDYLKSILKNGFYPRCCVENFSFVFKELPKEESNIGYCMVCFCDLPEPLQENHRNNYGEYGISLKKEWGLKNGICPILYIPESDREGTAIASIQYISSQIKGLVKSHIKNYEAQQFIGELMGESYQLFGYLKKYEEKFRDGSVKCYYDEREWRYLMPWLDGESQKLNCTNAVIGEDTNNMCIINNLNRRMEKRALKFNVDDIEKIILPSDNDKNEMRDFIREEDSLGRENLNLLDYMSLTDDNREKLSKKIL